MLLLKWVLLIRFVKRKHKITDVLTAGSNMTHLMYVYNIYCSYVIRGSASPVSGGLSSALSLSEP